MAGMIIWLFLGTSFEGAKSIVMLIFYCLGSKFNVEENGFRRPLTPFQKKVIISTDVSGKLAEGVINRAMTEFFSWLSEMEDIILKSNQSEWLIWWLCYLYNVW